MEYTLDDLKSIQIKTKFFSELSETVISKYATFWYPLQEINSEIDVISFEANFLEDEEILQSIKNIFMKNQVCTVCIIPELDNVYYSDTFLADILQQDEDGFVFPYFPEQYIFDQSHKWLIYKSHEFTVTFAGKWLVMECKKYIKNNEKKFDKYTQRKRIINKAGGAL